MPLRGNGKKNLHSTSSVEKLKKEIKIARRERDSVSNELRKSMHWLGQLSARNVKRIS